MLNDLILTLSCRDRPGITARVTGVLFELGGNILEAQQFNEIEDGEFFMRVAFAPGASDIGAYRAALASLATELPVGPALSSADRRTADGGGSNCREPPAHCAVGHAP